MPHIATVDLTQSDAARADIEWLASATGLVANCMVALPYCPPIANAMLEPIPAASRSRAPKRGHGVKHSATSLVNQSNYHGPKGVA